MSNKGYSPAALERRLKQAREAFRKKYHTDKEFRAREHERHKRRYHENKDSEQKRAKEYYERHKQHQRHLGRTQTPESSDIANAIRDYKFGHISFDEFDRRVGSAFARIDERIARESTKRRHKGVRSGSRGSGLQVRNRDPQTDAP